MKTFTLSLLFAAALLSTRWASAEEKPAAGPDSAALFKQLDANQDGQVSAAEVPDDKQRLFERLVRNADANADGQLSQEEFSAGLKNSRPERPFASPDDLPGPGAIFGDNPQAFFKQLDKNGDGKITAQEVPEEGRARFQMMLGRFDENGDGELSQAEFDKAAELIAKYRGQNSPPAGGPAGDALFRALDADGDGVLSSGEIGAAVESLRKLDRNADGQITREELGPPAGPGGAARPEGAPFAGAGLLQRLKEADKNGDSKLSKDEAPERLKDKFDQLDANKDGFLDQQELRQAMQALLGGQPPAGLRPGGAPGQPAAGELRKKFQEMDKNGDGKLSKDEAPERLKQKFDELDKNKDGQLDAQELRQILGNGKRPDGANRPKRKKNQA